MRQCIDLTGHKFNRLTVIKRVENDKCRNVQWLCKCVCGKEKVIKASHLRSDRTKSCGCLQKEKAMQVGKQNIKHGHSCVGKKSRIYEIWQSMIQRCNNPNNKTYKYYGGRGIKVCKKWLKFEGFLQDMGKKPERLTIDRIDNNKGYCKENCRWITMKEQMRNRRTNKFITINGITKCLAEHCEDRKLNYYTVYMRIYRYHWTPEESLELVPRCKKT